MPRSSSLGDGRWITRGSECHLQDLLCTAEGRLPVSWLWVFSQQIHQSLNQFLPPIAEQSRAQHGSRHRRLSIRSVRHFSLGATPATAPPQWSKRVGRRSGAVRAQTEKEREREKGMRLFLVSFGCAPPAGAERRGAQRRGRPRNVACLPPRAPAVPWRAQRVCCAARRDLSTPFPPSPRAAASLPASHPRRLQKGSAFWVWWPAGKDAPWARASPAGSRWIRETSPTE